MSNTSTLYRSTLAVNQCKQHFLLLVTCINQLHSRTLAFLHLPSVTPHHPTITSPPLPASPPLPKTLPLSTPLRCFSLLLSLLHSRLSQSGRTAGWRTGCGPPCAFLSFCPWDGLMLRLMTLTQGKVCAAKLFCMYELSMCPLWTNFLFSMCTCGKQFSSPHQSGLTTVHVWDCFLSWSQYCDYRKFGRNRRV